MRREDLTIRKLLMEELKEAVRNNERCIPPEAVLAEKLGISRTQLRDYLSDLENEGFITRRRGIGTIINQHVLDVPLRMDFEIEFADRVRAMGYEPETIVTGISMVMCDEMLAEKLGVGVGTPVQRVEKIVKASGRTAIYCIDNVSCRIIKNYDYTLDEFQAPIFDFLWKYCGTSVALDLTEVTAVTADLDLAGKLQIPEGSPVLNMNELAFDIDGKPIMWSQEYYVQGIIKYTVLRKNALRKPEEEEREE